MSKDNNKTGLIAGVAAALAAGAVYFYGPEGERRRERLRGWVLRAKGEILEKIEDAGEVTQQQYNEIIDNVMQEFEKQKSERKPQIKALREELKADWKNIKARMEKKGEELREAAAEEIANRADEISDQ